MESQSNMEFNKKVFNKVSEIMFGHRENNDIIQLTELFINNYSDFIVQEFGDDIFKAINTNKTRVKEQIGKAKNLIIKSISSFLKGNIFNAVNEVGRIFKYFDERTISFNHTLYRGRVRNTNYLFNREEMFHIPLNMRYLVKNQRFSLSGFPCLYLGETTLSCWEELERPDYGMTNFVSLKSTRDFRVLDLSYPYAITSVKDIVKISIIIACSLKTNKDDDFKSEYILPQLILHHFIKQRNCKKSNSDGIAYHSISLYNVKERLFQFNIDVPGNEFDRYISYVIPVSDVENKVKVGGNYYCSGLINLFNVSESTSSNIMNFQKSIVDNFFPSSDEACEPLYTNSCFAEIDNYLDKAEMSKLSESCERRSSYVPYSNGVRLTVE